MKKVIYCFVAALLVASFGLPVRAAGSSSTELTVGGEYYFYHLYYNRVLGEKADGTTPGLSVAGLNSNADSYIFVLESSGTDGYYLLRQKSSGKYLAASTSNSWSVLLQSSRGTSDNYLWSLKPAMQGSLSCKKSSAQVLGCDTGQESDAYVSVFYDKALGDLSTWQIFKVDGTFENSRKELYIEDLSRTIEEGQVMATQTNYSASWRSKVSTAVNAAQAVYAAATQKTLDELIEAAETLREVLAECRATDTCTLLSATDFNVDNAFTLALNGVRFTAADASVSVIARNGNGYGAVIDLSTGAVKVGDETIAASSVDAGVPHDFQFAFDGSSVQVYRDNVLLGSASSYRVPEMTTLGTEAEWTLLRASALSGYTPEVVSASAAVAQGEAVTDKYGNKVRYAVFLDNQELTLSEPVDFHIINEEKPLTNCTINLADEDAWLIFDNTLPSVVVSTYLSSIKINGQKAVEGQNVRVGVYLNGAVVIPHSSTIAPFAGYSGEAYAGDAVSLKLGANDLSEASNSFQGFILRRGYMATLASGTGGTGYSRVYVADHQDIMVPVLPQALNRRVSSVHIKKWNYVSKKGWCSTTGNASIATECKKVRATWFYTWSADRASTYDTEYIPIKQHLYWPSLSQIAGQTNSTHVLGYNEPEHAEQHTSDQCSCGGVISAWTACSKTPDLVSTGMRIGSPSPTDASWLYEYVNHCNDMAYRCDFVVMHCYWGTNEAANAAAWYSRLKEIYTKTKRPIWITEWNNGASWTTESWPSGYGEKLEKNRAAIKEILNVLDTCSFIERYSIYNWDSYYRAMINTDDGWVTPAGQVYRDSKSTFAYNADVQFIPNWWAPSLKTVELKAMLSSSEGKVVFTVTNTNGDMTDCLVIQRKKSDGTFEDYYSATDRSVFDQTEYTYAFDLKDFDLEDEEFRLYVKTTAGGETYSSTVSLGYLVNPNIVATSKTEIDGWVCQKSAANGYAKATGDTYLEVWDATASDMHFDYYQDVTDLANGVYELSAACFNNSNNEPGGSVNGHVGLYAQADGIEYFAPVTEDKELDLDDRRVIPFILVTDGTMRIGVKNLGAMTARWAGADEFKLRYLGTMSEALPKEYREFVKEMRDESDARYFDLFAWNGDKTQADATGVIRNPDCNRQDTYGWTVSTIDYSSDEGFDGVSTNLYWNKWSSAAYTSEMHQDFAYLPAGEYTASALLRCSVHMQMELYVSRSGGFLDEEEVVQVITGTGATSSAGAEYVKGWQKITAPSVILRGDERLRVGMRAVSAAGNDWWSADHFTLSFEPVDFTSVQVIEEGNNRSFTVTSGKNSLSFTASESVTVDVYTALGTLVACCKLEVGTTTLPGLAPGVYIVDGAKYVVFE